MHMQAQLSCDKMVYVVSTHRCTELPKQTCRTGQAPYTYIPMLINKQNLDSRVNQKEHLRAHEILTEQSRMHLLEHCCRRYLQTKTCREPPEKAILDWQRTAYRWNTNKAKPHILRFAVLVLDSQSMTYTEPPREPYYISSCKCISSRT